MKTLNTIKNSALMILLLAFISSCQKVEVPIPTLPFTGSDTTDIASKVAGNYLGDGVTASGINFTNELMKISKVTNTRVKVEPVNHSHITTFEVEVIEIMTAVMNELDDSTTFAIQLASNPISLAFDCPNTQTFGGFKQ